MGPAEIRRLRDPIARAQAAMAAMEALEAKHGEIIAIRDEAVREAVAAGGSYAKVGDLIGISKQRVAQVVND